VAPHEPFGTLTEPDRNCDRQTHEHACGEDILDETQPSGVPDQRKGESRRDRLAHRLDDRGQEDQESPEDQGVHEPGEGSLEQLALSEDVGSLPRCSLPDVSRPGDRTPGKDEPGQEGEPPCEKPSREGDQKEQDQGSGDHR
jgi:hypothetical protein